MPFPIADYDGDLEKWATDVENLLTEQHRADVLRVRCRIDEPGCPGCRMVGCHKCYWPKTVRYWRRVETGGKFADTEGYTKLMKAPTALEID